MKVLHIVHVLTRGGGLCNFIMNYYREIDRNKIQFAFLYFDECESDFKEEITSLGGEYYKMLKPSFSKEFFLERETFFCENKGKFEVVHCHVLFAAAFFADVAKKYGARSIFVHSHSTSLGYGILRKIRNIYFVRMSDKKATVKVACSLEAGKFMFGRKSLTNYSVLPNAIKISKYLYNDKTREKIRRELSVNKDIVLGHVGGFTDIKNHKYIIEIFSCLLKKEPRMKLLLVGGEGTTGKSTMSSTKQEVINRGIEEKVIFCGIKNNVNQLMMAMDVFILPSLFEGFGLSVVEAQAAGLYCCVSNNVPQATNCTGKVKYLSLEENPEKWAEEIMKGLIENSDRKISITKFEAFDIDKNADKIMRLYENK